MFKKIENSNLIFREKRMKHRFLKAALTALLAAGAIQVSAANPFADVDESSWSYKAVSQLSEEGVVDGYPDGTFRGDKNVTRYEMSQIIAKLMAKEGSLNEEQKATVQKLSNEYKDELTQLGVRVTELEKKVGNLNMITELRVQSVPRYNNIYKDSKDKYSELSARVRFNSIARVNDRSTVYGQIETYMSLNGKDVYDVNKNNYDSKIGYTGDQPVREGHGDGNFHLNRLWATYQFGKKQDTSNLPFGPSKNLIGIGQFPVKMGVTGYTYDGQFKGAFITFGDYIKGGRLTIAYGRATDINYNYTGPMLHGISGMKNLVLNSPKGQAALGDLKTKLSSLVKEKAVEELAAKGITSDTPGYANYMNAAVGEIQAELGQSVNDALKSSSTGAEAVNKLSAAAVQSGRVSQSEVNALISSASASNPDLVALLNNYNPSNDTYYPMADKGVVMDWGDDEDVPVAYMSYIYNKPNQWEFHAYGMTAVGPISEICKAYGFAGSYNITPMWRVQGEYVKNIKKLPLNNERPYSFNYGLHYGTADILKARSFDFGIDYVYSKAGSYFGGSSNDIVDQYMGHVYSSWHGMKNVPAYIADKMDALMDGDPTNDNNNYGGAKFFLAKASYVPIKGMLVEVNYGFNAKDMGGRKMDDMLMVKVTGYIR